MNDPKHTRVTKDGIHIYHPDDHAGMHVAGKLAAEILDAMVDHVFVGQTTGEIDRIITQMVEDAGAISATIGLSRVSTRQLHQREPCGLPRHPRR